MEELLAVDGTEEADDKKDNGPVGDSEKIGKHMKTRCQEAQWHSPSKICLIDEKSHETSKFELDSTRVVISTRSVQEFHPNHIVS